jgi:uncharacterized membrane protein YgcG
MKPQILLLAITAAALGSCTTAYKTGQTPDDVYFSPVRPQDEYVKVEKQQDDEYRYDDEYYDDRYLRMKVHNRTQWNYLDDWYSYDRYSNQYNLYYNSYYNPYTSWNYYYNPYCRNNVVVYNPKTTSVAYNVQRPRNFNLNSYTNSNYNVVNNGIKMSGKSAVGRPVYINTNTNNSNGLGNMIKQIFTGNGNSSNSSFSPSRSYSPSSSSGSSGGSSSGSSGGGGGASRPSRGGN